MRITRPANFGIILCYKMIGQELCKAILRRLGRFLRRADKTAISEADSQKLELPFPAVRKCPDIAPKRAFEIAASFADMYAEKRPWIDDESLLPRPKNEILDAIEQCIDALIKYQAEQPWYSVKEELDAYYFLRIAVNDFQPIDEADQIVVKQANAGLLDKASLSQLLVKYHPRTELSLEECRERFPKYFPNP